VNRFLVLLILLPRVYTLFPQKLMFICIWRYKVETLVRRNPLYTWRCSTS